MAQLIKIGNSQGIRIPKPLIQQARLEGKELDIQVVNQGILVTPSRKPRENLKKAIETAGPGVRIRTISGVIEDTVEKKGFSVVHDLTGHGIGKELHEDPVITNFRDDTPGPMLQPGMTIAIEPIINMGHPEIKLLRDGWTYVTLDRSLSMQVEHTIAITEKGAEILTKRPS